jgi:hypothetical protein
MRKEMLFKGIAVVVVGGILGAATQNHKVQAVCHPAVGCAPPVRSCANDDERYAIRTQWAVDPNVTRNPPQFWKPGAGCAERFVPGIGGRCDKPAVWPSAQPEQGPHC